MLRAREHVSSFIIEQDVETLMVVAQLARRHYATDASPSSLIAWCHALTLAAKLKSAPTGWMVRESSALKASTAVLPPKLLTTELIEALEELNENFGGAFEVGEGQADVEVGFRELPTPTRRAR